MLAGYVKKHTSYDELFELMCNMLAIGMVYPSKVTHYLSSLSKIYI
jgi:hypothetical protein